MVVLSGQRISRHLGRPPSSLPTTLRERRNHEIFIDCPGPGRAHGPLPVPTSRTPGPKRRGTPLRVILKAKKGAGTIQLDSETTLSGIPPECWDYKLGNRSELEWVLDQYKEKKPRDSTVAEKFNTYRFADYKEQVIDLMGRVTRVSVETMEIVEAMRQVDRSAPTED